MLGKRRPLRHESLEDRRLLAANCQPTLPAIPASEQVTGEQVAGKQVTGGQVAGKQVAVEQTAAGLLGQDVADQRFDRLADPSWLGPTAPLSDFGVSSGPDLVQEVNGKLYAVDQSPHGIDDGRLFVFERGDDGILNPVADVEVGFSVQRMIVRSDQVLLFGVDFNVSIFPALGQNPAGDRPSDPLGLPSPVHLPTTLATTVNLGGEIEVIHQEFAGAAHEIHHQDDRVVMVATVARDPTTTSLFPSFVHGRVTDYLITDDGLVEVAVTDTPLFGATRVRGDDLLTAHNIYSEIFYLAPTEPTDGTAEPTAGTDQPGPDRSFAIRAPDYPVAPTVTVSRYALGNDSIDPRDQLELGPGFLLSFHVAEDGQTGVLVRSEFAGAGSSTAIDLLDFSGDRIGVFQTVRLPEFRGRLLTAGGDHLLLKSYDNESLIVVDTNQDIDVDLGSRIRQIEISSDLHKLDDHLQLSQDLVILRGDREMPADASGVDPGRLTATETIRQTVLLSVSLSRGEIIAVSAVPDDVGLPHSERLILIEAETERFGFVVHAKTAGGDVQGRLLFGRLNQDGEFQRDGSIPIGRWLEMDASADRLIVREPDRLLRFDWQDPQSPLEPPLEEPNVPGEVLQLFASRREFLVELGLRAVDDAGVELRQVTEGQNFWLEFHAQDLRRLATGVFAAFFDLALPTEQLVVTGPVEYGDGFTSIRVGGFDEGEIDDLGAIANHTERPGNEQQRLLRIGVRAVASGDVMLRPQPSDAIGTEVILHGRQTEVPASRVRYLPLPLSIVPSEDDPLDTDGNGIVGASDALLVINFLGRYGTTSLEDLADVVAAATNREMTEQEIDRMRRLDTNRNGTIAAIDALLVINRMGRDQATAAIAESQPDDESLDDNLETLDIVDGLASHKLF